MIENIGGVRNSSEAFGFLALATLGSANTGYTANSVCPNFGFAETSYSPIPLSEIRLMRLEN